MSTILALETSTRHGSLAVWRDGALVREWAFTSDRSHNSQLFTPLREAWARGQPNLLVVGTGPGSYSGIRVALSAAVGLSVAAQAPLLGWPSLTAFDAPSHALVIGDARRGSAFVATLVDGRLESEPELLPLAELPERLAGQSVWTFDETPLVAQAQLARPTAAWLARRAAALSTEEITHLTATPAEPLYLRAPYITTPRGRGKEAGMPTATVAPADQNNITIADTLGR